MTEDDTAAVHLMTVPVATEQDTFALRRCGRSVAELYGVEHQDQIRLATALSELGRDLLAATALTVEFTVSGGAPPVLLVTLRWQGGPGPGREALGAAARLVRIRRDGGPETGHLTVEQPLLISGTSAAGLTGRAREVLSAHAGSSGAEDARAQTRDLIAALEESRAQREELHRLNQELEETNRGVLALYSELSAELEETNRGVVALYAELDEKSRLLREASEAKTRFWANVSHELRTPVNSVVGLAGLLLDGDQGRFEEEERMQLGLIAASGRTLLTLVEELLDVAKAESGRLEPAWSRVDLRALLGELRGTLRAVGPAEQVTLAIADPSTAPPLVSDEVMLTRILRNLLSNALKFTERGTVALDVTTGQDGELVLTVTDTGVGIPADQQERIFEEFYQVRGPHQRGRSGTGLGLPYARRLAGLLGGTLTLTSTPGEGTAVTVRLPAGPPAQEPPAQDPPGRVAVLVTVDDDEAYRAVVRPLLDQVAERVIEVAEGGRALEAVRREHPDAVLLDLQMPDLDGYQVLAQLAADPTLRQLPVVVITSADPSVLEHDRLAHARAVLDKRTLAPQQLATAFAAPPVRALDGRAVR
ncbi:hybrid sensor histidine kinase/response regulator [Kitasatospora sp. NPDC096147]|uniref:ATP-binding response regulator n=1 Tax=Kitasatospora sp. NPDC096147 TaxID=3364093 RepID=UPI00382439E7